MNYKTIEDYIGNTPLVRLQRLPGETSNTLLVKLEGNNPAGSVKDRPALSMIRHAEERGSIKPGDTLIEATSGNTGIALAMAAAIKGYRMILVMPEHMSMERRAVMKAYGAELVLTPKAGSMEAAIDKARELEAAGEGVILDQFSNQDNPQAHIEGTGPEIWRDTDGKVTHFVSAMGTTGIIDVSQEDAEQTTRELAAREGIFAGISSGGAVAAALKLSEQVENAVIVAIICDRGDRYLSTDVFPAD
ncbi:MAG: pyridoxal-phosphate dependent enzyme [Candidatus Thiodiazotropha sp.]